MRELMASASRTAPEGEERRRPRVSARRRRMTRRTANEFIYTALIDAQSKGGDPNAKFETHW